ncbi:MAG: hypothetical protein QOJ84_5330 [Bradyrhizobium sp.]|jgi:hypothetical protein|nr:hypothetical protein [Bradyrhizobium sp.]
MKLRCLVVALTLLAAFASDSWGQSQQPTPPPTQSTQPNQTPKPYERGTEDSPIIVKVLPTKESDEKATADARHENEKAENDRRLARFTEALFWATGALSVIALFQLFVFGWQGVQLKRSVSAAKEATELGNREFISTHRPKIIVYGLDFCGNLAEEKPVPISFRYVNAGDSDAKITGFGSHIERVDTKAKLPSGIEFKHQEIEPPIEVPSGMHGFRLTPDTVDPLNIVTMGEIMDEDRLFCVGYVLYRDGNGTRRQMGFCRQYDIGAGRWVTVQDDEYEYSY